MKSGEDSLVSLLVAVVLCCAVPLKMNLKDDSFFLLIFVETSFFLLVADGGECFFFSTSLFFSRAVAFQLFVMCSKPFSFYFQLFFYLWSVFFCSFQCWHYP